MCLARKALGLLSLVWKQHIFGSFNLAPVNVLRCMDSVWNARPARCTMASESNAISPLKLKSNCCGPDYDTWVAFD